MTTAQIYCNKTKTYEQQLGKPPESLVSVDVLDAAELHHAEQITRRLLRL